jgi:hypothetical protein
LSGPGDSKSAFRILYVDAQPSPRLCAGLALGGQFEVLTSTDPRQALSMLENDLDFAVVIARVGSSALDGPAFLDVVKYISPTSTRLVLSDGGVDLAKIPLDLVFRSVDEQCPPELLRQIITDAAHYHALLAASPIQPVEPPRRMHAALLPPDGLSRDSLPGPPDVSAPLLQQLKIRDFAPAISPLIVEMPPSRVGLRLLGRVIELVEGTTLVGRSRTCHVPINDRHISRRHACISNERGALSIKNVSSTNTLSVNGVGLGVEQSRPLQIGDVIQLGANEIEVCSVGDYCPSIEPTQRLSPETTGHQTMTLLALSPVANKYFLLGQSREAERILRPVLLGLIRHAASGRVPIASDVSLAVDLALKIVESNHASEWIDYVFDLYAALKQPAEQDVVDRLYRVIPETPGIRIGRYRAYVETLGGLEARLGPAQRFLVRRIQGLETRLMMSAHV